MPEIRDTISAYCSAFSSNDRARWLACFAPGATLEDPVGTPVRSGADEIGAFFDQSQAAADSVELSLAGDPVVCGSEAAVPIQITAAFGGAKMRMPAVDIMRFDADGLIVGQRAFVDFALFAPVASE